VDTFESMYAITVAMDHVVSVDWRQLHRVTFRVN